MDRIRGVAKGLWRNRRLRLTIAVLAALVIFWPSPVEVLIQVLGLTGFALVVCTWVWGGTMHLGADLWGPTSLGLRVEVNTNARPVWRGITVTWESTEGRGEEP